MALLAKRVSALVRTPTMASTSRRRARARHRADLAEDLLRSGVIRAYALPILMLRKRAGLAPWPVPITCSGWPLPQFGTPHSVQCSRSGDGGAGVPEFRGDAAVAGILQHADALAVADLPADFAAELEVVALVVDGPAPVGLHVDGVVGAPKTSSSDCSPGSRLTLVMRMSGRRDQPSARMQPLERASPTAAAVSREVM